ncbi:hypothetical protein J6590_046979 [Homalodisca vitripennis]|nr:hypothetical protein J6590_046979 [Homalodisca vitripennis]
MVVIHHAILYEYLNCLIGDGLVQCLDKATRVTEHITTCLDHVFVTAVQLTTVTDHYSTGLRITVHATDTATDTPLEQHDLPGPRVFNRPHATATATDTPLAPITYTDEKQFTECLITSNWNPVLNCYDVNVCSAKFSDVITESLSFVKNEIKHPTQGRKNLKHGFPMT